MSVLVLPGVKYVMCILNCKKYDFKRRMQLDTWVPDIPSDIFWFHLQGNLELKECTYDSEKHILTVPANDSYEGVARKMYLVYAYINKLMKRNPGIIGVIKLDDDVFISMHRLYKLVSENQDKDYFGNTLFHRGTTSYGFEEVENKSILPVGGYQIENVQFCGGPGYYLSRKAIEIIAASEQVFNSCILEDLMVGLALKGKVHPHHLPICSSANFGSAGYVIDAYRPEHRKYYQNWELTRAIYERMK